MEANKENEFPLTDIEEGQVSLVQLNKTESPIALYKSGKMSNSRLTYISHNDSTLIEETSIWRQTTDASFENTERMCSMNDSTINNNASTVQKEESTVDEETAALNRLLNRFDVNEKMNVNLSDITQLNDIEAPSALWENTISNDTTLQSSPVKMIGRLRPSTILEESSSLSESTCSRNSYKSAGKFTDFTSTDQYETANDSAEKNAESASSSSGSNKSNSTNSESSGSYDLNNVSHQNSQTSSNPDFDVFPHKKFTFYGENLGSTLISPHAKQKQVKNTRLSNLGKDRETTSSNELSSQNKSTTESVSSNFDDSLNYFRLDRKGSDFTEDSLNPAPHNTIISDPNTDLIDFDHSFGHYIKIERRSSSSRIGIDSTNDSVISVSDDDSNLGNNYSEEDDLNKGFSVQMVDETNDSINSSKMGLNETPPEFNDTIEEMEYIMLQGMKYMQKSGAVPKNVTQETLYPSEHERQTPSPRAFSPKTPSTVISKQKNINANVKSGGFTSNNFKKPLSSSKKPQHKVLNSCKKQSHFNHIISPVGAYIKNTPKTPITSTIRPTHDLFHSRAVRELEYNSKPSTNKNIDTNKGFPLLPKKAYITAEYKHVVDDRKHAVIPGGEKIHRYLHSSKVPAVIRHEGKIKMNIKPTDERETNRTVDSSLADLSLMSGDVSVLVLRDAKPK